MRKENRSDKSSPQSTRKAKAADPFEKQYSKSQLQQIRIIEAAIISYARRGISGTSYTTLADDCSISRPLIHHYFPTLDSLFVMAAKRARSHHLQTTLERTQSAGPGGHDQLREYVNSSFDWIEQNPDYAKFWLLYYYQCSLGGALTREHEELIQAGENRIEQYLQAMPENLQHRALLAKTIQMIVIGGTISAITEPHLLSFEKAKKLTMTAVDAAIEDARKTHR